MGAAGFTEQAAGGALAEVVFGEGLAGNELQAEAIDEGAHGFEQVASERVSAEAELVVVANGRVQPGAVQRQGDFGAGKGEPGSCCRLEALVKPLPDIVATELTA